MFKEAGDWTCTCACASCFSGVSAPLRCLIRLTSCKTQFCRRTLPPVLVLASVRACSSYLQSLCMSVLVQQTLVSRAKQPIAITHICAHSNLKLLNSTNICMRLQLLHMLVGAAAQPGWLWRPLLQAIWPALATHNSGFGSVQARQPLLWYINGS